MAKRDYYEVLGVGRDSDADAIKRSYRRLAMKHHPDRNAGDAESEAKFKEIQEAYACLSDAKKRAAYDRFGHAAFEAGGDSRQADFSSAFESIFGDFFGGQDRHGAQQRVVEVRLDFLEVIVGCTKEITLQLPEGCGECRGSGCAPGCKPVRCSRCEGKGVTRSQSGFFSVQQTCTYCGGRGYRIEKPCSSCNGRGEVVKNRRLSVNIPAGVDNGMLISLNTGSSMEIYLRAMVRPHPLFERHGDDLHIEVPVSMVDAALGAQVEVPSAKGGRIEVRIPEGTQNGRELRLSGQGVPNVRSGRPGNLLCHVTVEVPVGLSDEQKELLGQFRDSLKKKHSPKGQSWLNKVKRLFAD